MENTRTIKRIAIIGAGGVASYLIPVLMKTLPETTIEIWDKDTLEKRNLDRQLFHPASIGENKALALMSLQLGPGDWTSKAEFFHSESEIHEDTDVIICVCDNHPARKAALQKADEMNIPVIIGANEYFDSEAFIYYPEWSDTHRDPRNRYPEILTDTSGDPLGCQGDEAIEANPQLAIANMAAAAKVAQLLWAWEMTDTESKYLPYEISSNLFEHKSERQC